jgi:hypothetical protein
MPQLSTLMGRRLGLAGRGGAAAGAATTIVLVRPNGALEPIILLLLLLERSLLWELLLLVFCCATKAPADIQRMLVPTVPIVLAPIKEFEVVPTAAASTHPSAAGAFVSALPVGVDVVAFVVVERPDETNAIDGDDADDADACRMKIELRNSL